VKEKIFALALGAILFALTFPAGAQHPVKVARIGYLGHVSASVGAGTIQAFRQGLAELGHVEGKNIVIEWRHHEGKLDRLPALAADLVRLKVDVIITSGPPLTRAAKEATTTIPIVMAQDRDPVGNGFVASLARPGGNITGLSRLAPELSGKQLELLKEIVPKLSRLAVFGTSTTLGTAQELKDVELIAGALGVTLQYVDVLNARDIETAFRAAGKARSDAVLMIMEGAVASTR
jgi:putative ABC transport system substrate-binding protein